jgi:adenosylhomocysteine nucleosidase
LFCKNARRMTRLGIVTGLISEAGLILNALNETLPRPAVMVQCRGPGPERATRAADILLSAGCTALMSFGVAGGLSPDHGTGTLVLPRIVQRLPATDSSTGLTVSALWHHALVGRLRHDLGIRVTTTPLVSSAQVISSAADKKKLFDLVGATAVDMESYAVAQVASNAGVPFLALRAIMDSASQSIPPQLQAAMREDGSVDNRRALLSLLRAPWLISDARKLQKQSAAAHAELAGLLRGDLLARRFLVDVTHE